MNSPRDPVKASRRTCQLLALLALAAACSKLPSNIPEGAALGEWRPFEGTWTASGSRRTLRLGQERRASTVDLSGSVLLAGQRGLGVGFQAEVVGLSDSASGFVGRCVWTDERGDQVYSELRGEFVGSGNRIVGTVVGGTGRWAGITGEYEFQWQYVIENEDGVVSGRATGLKGRARLSSLGSTPSTGGPRR